MTYQEKQSIVSLIGTIVIAVLYFAYVAQRYQEGGTGDYSAFGFWASVILLLIPVHIVLKVIIHIIFVIINKIATDEDEPSFSDEFDRLVSLKTTRNFFGVFLFGFMIALASQVVGQPPKAMFIMFALTLNLALVFGDVSQLYFYRNGV